MSIRILEGSREIEGIDPFVGVEIDIEIRPPNSIDEGLVFILRIEDDHVRSEHECSKNLELHGKRFSPPRLGKDTHIRILCLESIEDNK